MDAVMLAAGNSSRFGENKLLYPLDHKPVYRYMLELLYKKQKEHKLRHITAVSQYDEILKDIEEHFPGIVPVRNPEPEKGISVSVRLGLSSLMHADSQACLFAVADQPGFSETSFDRLINFWQSHDYGIAAAASAQPDAGLKMKNPVIFSKKYYQQLCSLTGDAGGKQVIRRYMEDTGLCEVPPFELEDLDTKDALARFCRRRVFMREFPFLKEKGHVTAIVGAGGKTALMDTLASCYADTGNKVIVTTTTHILRPSRYPVAENLEQLNSYLKNHWIVAAGADAPHGKLCILEHMLMADYRKAADTVLIEADGAKHFPCKVPIETEPVIPKESDIVIGVAGMDALGQPLAKACFRKEKAMELLGVKEGHLLTEADIVKILLSEQGTRKGAGDREYYIVLNKCDNEKILDRAQCIRRLLLREGAEHVACISCLPERGVKV